ncbi:MAG: Arc family DNA-binding protein [Planctomycetes bacterium]|nr:Arc family DNA-binding protein [Planctomycetota bacterium]
MASLTLKGMPDDLLARLRRDAEAHRRSLNQEVLALLEGHSRREPFVLADFMDRVRQRRERLKGASITNSEITATKNEGRP